LMPRTGSDLGLKQDWWFDGRRSIGNSTDAALNYLLYLNKFFNGNWILAIAAYDSGEGTVARAIKTNENAGQPTAFWNLPTPAETRVYVPRFLALAEIINNPQRYHVDIPAIPYLPYFKEVNIGSQIDLNHAARLAGMTYKELIKLNPGFNRWTTAPYKPFRLLIPTEKVQRFNQNLANFPEDKRVSWTKHQVKTGDDLASIAARYHTTVNLIKQLNQLTGNHVAPNQAILIPSSKNTGVVAAKALDLKAPIERTLVGPRDHRVIHIVQNNDTFKGLEKTYGVTSQAIRSWNKLDSTKALHQGQQLIIWKKVQQPKEYLVKAGDSLSMIAKMHQTKVNTILSLNPGMKKNTPLRLGQKLLVG
ncbi:MAG: LysM peptidoglycan-binding domain-containing protein, partial [Legionellales bacterium]